MITIVVAGYAALMLTIVLSLVASAARSTPKPSDVVLDDSAVRRAPKPVFAPASTVSNSGGTEVLAFEA